MATNVSAAAAPPGLGNTHRQDAWWVGSLLTALGFGLFIVYSTFRAFYNGEYLVAEETGFPGSSHILSPFYSPLIAMPESLAWISPAFLILWAPGGFRFTCYYYRKAYYRAFFWDPPACAVGEARKEYNGETALFIFQNLHRYFMYLAIIFLFILSYDVLLTMWWPNEDGTHSVGMSVATLVLAANVVFLSLYTFSCHSLRHLIGGKVDCFSCVAMGQTRHDAWKRVSALNKNHMLWAWVSLFGVGLADLYVWLVASRTITDFRLF